MSDDACVSCGLSWNNSIHRPGAATSGIHVFIPKPAEVAPVLPEPPDVYYQCAHCDAVRTGAEGGKIFTVCDACWDKAHPRKPDPGDRYDAAGSWDKTTNTGNQPDPGAPCRHDQGTTVFGSLVRCDKCGEQVGWSNHAQDPLDLDQPDPGAADAVDPFAPGGSRYGEVCLHGSLTRQCNTCALEAEIWRLRARVRELEALVVEAVNGRR